jgi:hypothetical protein
MYGDREHCMVDEQCMVIMNIDFLNRCSDGRSETADAKISSKRGRFTIHMLNSEVGWITDRPFNFSPRFI